jgi:hypothetical protein
MRGKKERESTVSSDLFRPAEPKEGITQSEVYKAQEVGVTLIGKAHGNGWSRIISNTWFLCV